MSSSQEDLRRIALAEFASAGYSATSLQHIAELAGLSKASVLYHYGSKEALLDAAIGPAIDRMAAVLEPLHLNGLRGEERQAFLEEFVDFLLEYRLEVHIFINQGPSLVDVPVIDRANALVRQLADFFATHTSSVEEKMRFGVALGGAAYMLGTFHGLGIDAPPISETRAALVTILSELLTPVRTNP
ncbi:AcrR family transcriptional regulator [Microbacteriaceae bacterium SG_E_30_P1]|uniref:AcrR family transcriptional regulator n=1 Tax=Antiquaquibacter oligotrophicus TaxID=2880260 RepID=A0ABT6KNN6_9MICO|nr:TetR/AcrR family transcriptional regulator [Antiquaquibacter oligotrophicus]MDH6181619.1 AcrR family transcriptional regulator [Antiquaquibacter oligotrophicus]UDF12696.1 TetR/AcrR family transcriptional regulator [Antiquaquibacter oligotrophicus]